MSKETEKIFSAFDKFMEANGRPNSEEEMREMFQTFMNEYNSNLGNKAPVTPGTARTAEDYLELSETADTAEEALRYAKKALKLDPDNLDAEGYVAAFSAKDAFDAVKKFEAALEHGKRVMEKQGYFAEECIGSFWLIHQTRPYIRLAQGYVDYLIEACMFDAAIHEAEDIIRLNETDNTGTRYTLMALYAMAGDEERALALYDRYEEESAMMLMPLAVLYYRKKELKTALKYLKLIMKRNPDLKKFLKSAVESDEDIFPKDFDPTMYRPYTLEEILVAVFENTWLYTAFGMFFPWAYSELTKTSSKTATKKSGSKKSAGKGKKK